MCNHKVQVQGVFEKQYRLADFFNMHWETYVKDPKEYIQPEQYKAVNSLRVCRTAALGVDMYACPDCGDLTEVYHSCKNRFCPTCSWQDTIKWAERVKNQMLDIPHRHIVFTMPHGLNRVIKENGKYLLNTLMVSTADTLKDWIMHKYGVKVGIISVLHTFGEKKDIHYHVHMIVSWGGMDKTTGVLKGIKGEYVNYDFLKNKFRCKFEDWLVKLYDRGQLESRFKDRVSLMRFIRQINKKNWMFHIEPAMEVPSKVVRYIGRYSKRACLSEYKITKMEGEYIGFRYKDYKNTDIEGKPIEKEMVMHYRDFFPRLLQHVPLPYFRLVRYYGVYSNRSDIPKEYLFKETNPVEEPDSFNESELYCSHCKKEKEYQYTYVEKRIGKVQQMRYTYIRLDRIKRKVA